MKVKIEMILLISFFLTACNEIGEHKFNEKTDTHQEHNETPDSIQIDQLMDQLLKDTSTLESEENLILIHQFCQEQINISDKASKYTFDLDNKNGNQLTVRLNEFHLSSNKEDFYLLRVSYSNTEHERNRKTHALLISMVDQPKRVIFKRSYPDVSKPKLNSIHSNERWYLYYETETNLLIANMLDGELKGAAVTRKSEWTPDKLHSENARNVDIFLETKFDRILSDHRIQFDLYYKLSANQHLLKMLQISSEVVLVETNEKLIFQYDDSKARYVYHESEFFNIEIDRFFKRINSLWADFDQSFDRQFAKTFEYHLRKLTKSGSKNQKLAAKHFLDQL